MSTKTSILYIEEEDVHLYRDMNLEKSIVLEISKQNKDVIFSEDEDSFYIEFTNPKSELYKSILKMQP